MTYYPFSYLQIFCYLFRIAEQTRSVVPPGLVMMVNLFTVADLSDHHCCLFVSSDPDIIIRDPVNQMRFGLFPFWNYHRLRYRYVVDFRYHSWKDIMGGVSISNNRRCDEPFDYEHRLEGVKPWSWMQKHSRWKDDDSNWNQLFLWVGPEGVFRYFENALNKKIDPARGKKFN